MGVCGEKSFLFPFPVDTVSDFISICIYICKSLHKGRAFLAQLHHFVDKVLNWVQTSLGMNLVWKQKWKIQIFPKSQLNNALFFILLLGKSEREHILLIVCN